MKVASTKHSPYFTPRTISITFENQTELDAFAAVFNYSPVVEAVEQLGEIHCTEIRDRLTGIGGDCSRLHRDLDVSIDAWFRKYRAQNNFGPI